ncbi:CopG family transcriptional regulator [Candidatus Altiarchaeota archaeon]
MRKSSGINTKYTTVSIPETLAVKVRDQIRDTGFKSLSDYVTFVLREIVSTKREWDDTLEAQEKVKEKLRMLGYL